MQDSPRESGTTRLMREESHLDDMRSAIRGDFERLAERRGGQELMSVPSEPPSEPERDLVPADGPEQPDPVRGDTVSDALEAGAERDVQPHLPNPVRGDTVPEAPVAQAERDVEPEEPAGEPDPLPAEALEVEPEPVDALAGEVAEPEPDVDVELEAPRRSWLDRLLGR